MLNRISNIQTKITRSVNKKTNTTANQENTEDNRNRLTEDPGNKAIKL